MSRRDQLSNASIRCLHKSLSAVSEISIRGFSEGWEGLKGKIVGAGTGSSTLGSETGDSRAVAEDFSAKSQETYNNILCFLSVIATVYYILYYLTLHASMSFYAMKEYLVVRA